VSQMVQSPITSDHRRLRARHGLRAGGAGFAVERTAHGLRALAHDVRVDHGGLEIRVAEQLLDRADVVTILEQMRGEAVPPMSSKT